MGKSLLSFLCPSDVEEESRLRILPISFFHRYAMEAGRWARANAIDCNELS